MDHGGDGLGRGECVGRKDIRTGLDASMESTSRPTRLDSAVASDPDTAAAWDITIVLVVGPLHHEGCVVAVK